jgi:FkbM family methyltransferase
LGETDVRYIVDCGANIGLTTLYLLHHYPAAQAVVVEPDAGNMRVCRRNLAPFARRVTFVQSGVWSASLPLVVERGRYADGGEWSFQVRPAMTGEQADLIAQTVDDLLNAGDFPRADILKMDIEAAEAELFAGPTEWLDRVRMLVIELHGQECERVVERAVAGRLARVGMCGELTLYQRRVRGGGSP